LQVTTEGDSFTVAFHDALDAVAWSLHVQQALLEAEWDPELLKHPHARVVWGSASHCSRAGQLLFKGLRVRIAINTGESGKYQYTCLYDSKTRVRVTATDGGTCC